MGKNNSDDDPAMAKVRELWAKKQAAGLTMQELGERMGHGKSSARQAISQLLKSHDPQIGTLRRFAKAIGVKISALVKD